MRLKDYDSDGAIGSGSDFPTEIRFEGDAGSGGTRTPVCPDCGDELRIAADAPDMWQLTCGCEETPAFIIERCD
jgi:hypothetical protein